MVLLFGVGVATTIDGRTLPWAGRIPGFRTWAPCIKTLLGVCLLLIAVVLVPQ
jgi:hypothetical protein